MSRDKMILNVEDKPDIKTLIIGAFQHVFAMFGSTILVPALVNNAVGMEVLSVPTTLIAAGVGTLIYILITKGRSPAFLGSSFAYITPMILGFAKAGTGGIFTGIIAVGLVYVAVALLIKISGKKWIDKVLPPVVIGPMIIIIGLSLASTVVNQIGLSTSGAIEIKSLIVASITFFTTAVIAIAGKGFLKASPFLVGITVGYIASYFMGMVDLSAISAAPFFVLPNLTLPIIDYQFNMDALLLIVPLAIVSISEHIGTHYALGNMINRNLLKNPGLDKTLLGNGLSILTAGLIGAPVNTIYGENTSIIGMTKIASVRVLALAAGIVVSLAFLGKASAFLETIPMPVLGAITLLLYGFILINGFKVLLANKVDFSEIRNVVIAATMLIIGLGGASYVIASKDISIAISGMSLAAIIGIILNLILPKESEI